MRDSDYIEYGNSKIETLLNSLTLKEMKFMRKITKIAYLVIVCMTISLSNINASSNSETTTYQTPQNKGLTVKISDKIIHVATPLHPSTAPITVRIVSSTGTILFEKTTINSFMVVSDGNNRVHSDSIEHLGVHSDSIEHLRVHSDSIEHLRVQVSQGGQVILSQKL